jgi:hypothetical protein
MIFEIGTSAAAQLLCFVVELIDECCKFSERIVAQGSISGLRIGSVADA